MTAAPLTIVSGTTFCVGDELGDICGLETSGLWSDDVRFLSLLRLTIGGDRPLLLASHVVEHVRSISYLHNPVVPGLAADALLITRERVVGAGMDEHLSIQNGTGEAVSFELELELAADFADVLTVKARQKLGPEAGRLPPRTALEADEDGSRMVFRDADPRYSIDVALSRPATIEGDRARYSVRLEPRGRWPLELSCRLSTAAKRRPADGRPTMTRLRAVNPALQRIFDQSLADLEALTLRGDGLDGVTGAGIPWFMTVFGRDTLVTCLQTMMLGPERAERSLRVLASLQADDLVPEIEAEPGKIIHELRTGKTAAAWFHHYYGTVDATPLFLVLLSEHRRWSGADDLARSLREPALSALRWIDEYGDRDGDGFVEYHRHGDHGLENQSWKDSNDSQRFADGRFAAPPIAPCEVQGYVYDAKLRTAQLAREVWGDDDLAERLEHEAALLQQRFQEAFWIEDRGGYYALALDGRKQPVDSLCSNIGHLLWSGIVPIERADAVAERLLGESLWSGWGIRTMSSDDEAYNPIGYHVGTVWPHDASLVAWGLARYGYWAELDRVAHGILDAAVGFDYQLPEVLAGVARDRAAFPIPYPTPCKPQAWAAGAPILLLRLLLGLAPDPATGNLVATAPSVPDWLGELKLCGVPAFGRSWDVRARQGAVEATAADEPVSTAGRAH